MTGEPQLGSHEEHMSPVAASHEVLEETDVERTRRRKLEGWQLKRNSGLNCIFYFLFFQEGRVVLQVGFMQVYRPLAGSRDCSTEIFQFSIFHFSKEW